MRLTLNIEDITLGDLRAFLSLVSGVSDETRVLHCSEELENYHFPDSLSIEFPSNKRNPDGTCAKCGTNNPLPAKTLRVKGARRYYRCSKCGHDWSVLETDVQGV